MISDDWDYVNRIERMMRIRYNRMGKIKRLFGNGLDK